MWTWTYFIQPNMGKFFCALSLDGFIWQRFYFFVIHFIENQSVNTKVIVELIASTVVIKTIFIAIYRAKNTR